MSAPVTAAIQFVRSNPGIFFAEGTPTPLGCAQHLLMEAMVLGATDVHVNRRGDWWAVSSPRDWLDGERVDDVFARIVPLPQAGPNTCRGEVVVNTFADSVVTRSPTGDLVVVSGQAPPPEIREELFAGGHRVVAFRFAAVAIEAGTLTR